MAKDVHDTVTRIVEKESKVETMEAIKIVGGWLESQRYVRDIWA